MKMSHCIAQSVLVCSALLTYRPALAQFTQQGPKLAGTGGVGAPQQGFSAAISADGNTAIVGGPFDNTVNIPFPTGVSGGGAAWVWIRSQGAWTQQSGKLVGVGGSGSFSQQGYSVSLSADGNTAIVGGPGGNGTDGAVWLWTRSEGVWTQQGNKLTGSGALGTNVGQGFSVSISADGNTAIVGGPGDGSFGAVWLWTRSGEVWSQQGPKLVGPGGSAFAGQGYSVSLSADGNTAIVGGPGDSSGGSAWIWTRSGGVWTQQGAKLAGSGGASVSLSGDGNTAIIGAPNDNVGVGAAWVWTKSGGVWTQQGTKLVGSGAVGSSHQGVSVSLSSDGNTAIVGGPGDNGGAGATWVWKRSGGVWTQQSIKLAGSGAVDPAFQGTSLSLSADGNTAIVGGSYDNGGIGAAWVFIMNPTVSPESIPTASVWTLIVLASLLALLGTIRSRA